MKQTLKIVLASALATAAVIKAVPALAEPAAGDVSISVVHTADLDLSTPGGLKALDARLAVAAHQVCDTASAVDLKARNAQQDCREAVVAQGRAKAQSILATSQSRDITIAARN